MAGLAAPAGLPHAMCWRFWNVKDQLLCQNGTRAASWFQSRRFNNQDSETYFLSSFPEGTFLVETMQSYFGDFFHAWIYRLHPTMLQVSSEASLFIKGPQTKSNGIETSFLRRYI